MTSVRQSFEALVADVVAASRPRCGYGLGAIAYRHAVEITLEKGGAAFVVWLRRAEEDTRSYRRTARFKVGHTPDPPDPLGYAVIDALCARLEAWERALSAAAVAPLFEAPAAPGGGVPLTLEWLAVQAGLKPACRNLVRPAQLDALVPAAAAGGLHLEHTEARAFLTGFRTLGVDDATTIVHAGASRAAALRAADAERAMIDTCAQGARASDAQVRALGAALGYPDCCVEAFLPVRDLSNAEIRFHALQRTAGPAARLLNDTAVDEQSLVSHCVCRYDCAPSLRYAAALCDAFARGAPAAAAALRDRLGGLMVVLRSGGAFRLALAAGAADPARLTLVDAGSGARFEAWRAALEAADGLEARAGQARILRGGREVARLDAPPGEVQIRLFS